MHALVRKPIMQRSVYLSVRLSVCLSVCLYICRGEKIAEAINPSQELNCQLTSPLIVTCFLFTRSAAPVQEETAVPVLSGSVLPVREETAVPVPVLAGTVFAGTRRNSRACTSGDRLAGTRRNSACS